MPDRDREQRRQVPEVIQDNSSIPPKDGLAACCEPRLAVKSVSVPFRLTADFVVEPEAPAEFLQDAGTSSEERDLFLTILTTPEALNRLCRLRIVCELSEDSREYFEGKFMGPQWEDILDYILPYLSAEQHEFWTRLRREEEGRYGYCINRIFQQFHTVLKTTEIRDTSAGHAIPLRHNSKFDAAS